MLKGYQKKYLKGLAHHLKPVVLIGQNGLTDTVVRSAIEALKKHELIKVKFIDHKEKEQKKGVVEALGQQTQSDLVGLIGHVAIFFKPHPDPAKRLISLPSKSVPE
jgi:RNA-binding protein